MLWFASCRRVLCAVALLPWLWSVAAEPQTVCTITVNSADEKEAFRRHLPTSKYRFVELVEPGRADWLSSACRSGIRCDVLILSGHYDGGNEFFSDRLETREYLTVSEMERVSCSGSCAGLFEKLKEVYLFGCNTLNPRPQSSASAEIVNSLVREGHSAQEARRQLQSLNAAHGEASRDRMRQIFKDVPVIYGFSSSAPLGPVAAATLERYLRAGGSPELARGHPSGRLLGYFAPFAMTSVPGMTDVDPHIDARREMCRFADDRLAAATKLAFVHGLLQRHIGETRLHLDRIQRLFSTLDESSRRNPAVAAVLADIANDSAARARLLVYAHEVSQPEVRVRLLDLAHQLGWLSADERWQELALMLGELQARQEVDVPEVGLSCSLNQGGDLDGAFNRRVVPGSPADDVAHAAVRACLGSAEGRTRTLDALVSPDEADVRIAQVYLRHRPITDGAELRRVAGAIVQMPAGDAQVRALEALGRHYVADRSVLSLLAQLFAQTPSWSVQNAIAGILIRADRRSIEAAPLVELLQTRRHPATAAETMIDALLHRLQTP